MDCPPILYRIVLAAMIVLPSAETFAQTSEDAPAEDVNSELKLKTLPAPIDVLNEADDTGTTVRPQPKTTTPVPSRFGSQPADEAFGAFQRGLYLTARNLAQPRAENGDPAAQTLLAEIYSRGLGVPRDVAEAAKWYEKAAAQGVAEAQFQYALILLRRAKNGTAKEGEAELAETYMKQAADAGKPEALFNYAQLILSKRPGTAGRSDAYPYFLSAAEKNIVDAQYAVAQYFANGTAPVSRDLERAAFWLTKAAQQNFDTAQLEIGQMLLSGAGISRNLEAGFGWVRRAALAGNVAARAELAKLYWAGIGTEPDSIQAGAWYVLVRRAGFRDSVLEDFWEGLSEKTQKSAIEAANRLG